MHGFKNLLPKKPSRSPHSLEKEDSTESWHSVNSSLGSRGSFGDAGQTKPIPINIRNSLGRCSMRVPSDYDHHERHPRFASSPRDRYPNFACYFREVMEDRAAAEAERNNYHDPEPWRHQETEHSSARHHTSSEYRRQRTNDGSYQIGVNTYKYDRNFPNSHIYGDDLDDIQENEKYSKCERYGEISNTKLNHFVYRNRFDNKSFAQKLVQSDSSDSSDSGRRGSAHKNHKIHDLIRNFGKKVHGWRHEEGRRASCVPSPSAESDAASEAVARSHDEFRTRSKSLDGGTLLRVPPSVLDDCGATYNIFDKILQEGANLRRKGQEADARRSSFGALLTARHRAADLSLDPHHAAMLFRDARGLPVADPFLDKVTLSDLEEDESQIFVKFFKFHKCYDLIPTSAKLVVFDTQLLVKKAFFALVYNGVRAAPLWDSTKQDFVGMLTITDFIKILQMYYTSPNIPMDQLEEHKLDTWRRVLAGSVKPLVSITPDSSLYDAIKMLISNRIHRLPVIDLETGNVLYILTHKRILRFLFLYINELPKPSYLQCKVRDLNMGTLNNIETATEETSIFEALKKFVNRRVSALPLIDSDGRLKDIYAKFDVINLAAEKTYHNLDVTLKKANEHRNEWFEGVQKCTLDETLFEVMERIVRAEVHRLVVVDEEEKVIGIISLSDLLNYLVLRPTGECNSDLRNELRKKILAERSASIGECSTELFHQEDRSEELDDPTSSEKDGSEKELDLLEDESKELVDV